MTLSRCYFGSLFAGIGGIDLGLERAGMVCRWQVESDPFCNEVLKKHWPDVRRYGDVRKADPERIEEECGRVRLVAGGFPCQDLSSAGKRKGIHAKRSGLWFEFERFVRVLRPEIVLVENVEGLLSGGLEVVLGCLAALGYDAEWDCVPAAVFGAPHLRHRVFVVAYFGGFERSAHGGSKDKESLAEGNLRIRVDGRASAGRGDLEKVFGVEGDERRIKGKLVLGDDGPGFEGVWLVETGSRLVRVADGVSKRLDETQKRRKREIEARIRSLGNAVVPQAAEWLGRRILRAVNEGLI